MKSLVIAVIFSSVLVSGCGGCSKSGRKERISNQSEQAIESIREKQPLTGEKTVVKMQKISGVNQIPVEVNGVRMHFIFDTGASIISISETEAIFLYKQGSLSREDIVGSANFTDANGDISEGTIINLRTVKIGSRVLENIKASVVPNLNAPLLFGQSALEKFGKISIDNTRQELTFEY